MKKALCCGVSEALFSEEAETCTVLPLGLAVAQFPRRNARSTDAEMDSSDNGDAHATSHSLARMADSFLSKISHVPPGSRGDTSDLAPRMDE